MCCNGFFLSLYLNRVSFTSEQYNSSKACHFARSSNGLNLTPYFDKNPINSFSKPTNPKLYGRLLANSSGNGIWWLIQSPQCLSKSRKIFRTLGPDNSECSTQSQCNLSDGYSSASPRSSRSIRTSFSRRVSPSPLNHPFRTVVMRLISFARSSRFIFAPMITHRYYSDNP